MVCLKILYGIQGTGNGHIARARAISEALCEHSVQVDYFFSGGDVNHYFSMACFGGYKTRKGLSFVSENGKVNYIKTALNSHVLELVKDINQLDLSRYDVVLNDFEPISAWAAKRQKKTCISISHQNSFRYAVPSKGRGWLDKKIISQFAPADHYLGLHWYHFDQPILPPIVHNAGYKNENNGFILVYLPFESIDEIYGLLSRFVNHRFVCFHPRTKVHNSQGNTDVYPLCYENFQKHLHTCSGVIANGGFELPSEAMSLGKKLLLKPLVGQFEQQSNVATLDMLGLATSMDSLDPVVLRCWLDVKSGDTVFYPNVAAAIVEWLMIGEWSNTQDLCQMLWKQVDFPSSIIID